MGGGRDNIYPRAGSVTVTSMGGCNPAVRRCLPPHGNACAAIRTPGNIIQGFIFRSIGNEFEVARTLHSLGNRLLERGDVAESEEHLEEARAIFQRIDSKVGDQIGRTIKEIKSQAKGSSKKGRSAKKKR